MDIKQVIVVRTKYHDKNGNLTGIRAGKLIAQACHVSQMWITNKILGNPRFPSKTYDNNHFWYGDGTLTAEQHCWLNNGHKKVTCQVSSEEELNILYNKAISLNLIAHKVIDEGLSEFHGVKTLTAIAIGPNKSEDIDVVTKDLKLY